MSSLNRKPHILDLPNEMLSQILKYLSAAERKAASETCHSWYKAANNYSLLKNKFVVCGCSSSDIENHDLRAILLTIKYFGISFYNYIFKLMITIYSYFFSKYSNVSNNYLKNIRDDEDNPQTVFLKSKVNFSNFIFKLEHISYIKDDFWIQLGDNIRTLEIRYCNLSDTDVSHILQSCKNLVSLSFPDCKFVWTSNLSKMTKHESNYELPNLKCIDLSYCNLSNAIFYKLVRFCPAIEKLYLTECNFNFTLNISDEYSEEPNSFQIQMLLDVESYFYITLRYVMTFIKTRSQTIKHLHVSDLSDSVIHYLNDCEDLLLESLQLNDVLSHITIREGNDFLKRQIQLKDLRLGATFQISDQLLLDICRNVVNLEHLNINCCRYVTDFGITELYTLRKLRSLHFPGGKLVTNEGMKWSLCREKNYILKKLYIPNSPNIKEDFIIMMAENFPNLRYLDVSDCNKAITETSLFQIFKHQTQLEVLIMKGSKKICNLGEYHKEKDDPSQIDLSCLKRLKQLNLAYCSNITNESIQQSLRLPRLVNLSLWRCVNVTHENIKCIVKNCPNIKYLNVGHCKNITFETVVLIVTSLKNLKQLSIYDTPASVDGIESIMVLQNMNPAVVIKYMKFM